MPDPIEVTGSRAGDDPGSTFSRTAGPDPYSAEGFSKFKEGLGELAADKSFEPIKDFRGLADSFVNAQKMVGGSLRLPGKDLSDEDRTKAVTELRGKLVEAGVLEKTPESPQGYEIRMPQTEGWEVNQPLYDSFRNFAHKVKMPPSLAQAAFDWYVNIQAESDAQEKAEFAQMKKDLQTEWGPLFSRKMEAARRAATKYLGRDGDDIVAQLPPSLGSIFVKAFSEIGESLLEDGFVPGEPVKFESEETLRTKINEILASEEYKQAVKDQNQSHSKVQEYMRLNKALSQLQLEKGRR